jgi:hypothetical protein
VQNEYCSKALMPANISYNSLSGSSPRRRLSPQNATFHPVFGNIPR